MQRMIPTYDTDLKRPENAPVHERTARAADEVLGL